jgi:hypothetical protein
MIVLKPKVPEPILKLDGEQQIVMGVVYAPGLPDSHGDYMTAEEIRKSCHDFVSKGDMGAVDVMHDNIRYGCKIVECFIVRAGDLDFPIEGSWVASVWCPDPIWERVKKGELNGFSLEAIAWREEKEIEMDFPGSVCGVTTKHSDDHTHEFEIMFTPEGDFIGGKTSIALDGNGNSHYHAIRKGVITEETAGHAHKFAYIENMPRLQDDEN